MNPNLLPMAALALLAALWLTRPLWQARLPGQQQRRSANVVAYRSRLAELEAEVAAGLLGADEAAALKAELDTRLLADAEGLDAEAAAAPRRTLPALVLALLFLLSGAAWYWQAGSWKVDAQVAAAPEASSGEPPDVLAMVARLEQRLQTQPDDAQGWAMLGRSYFVMERYGESAAAYGRANQLTEGRDAALLTSEGEALTLSRDRDLLGRPQQLFEAALKLAPDDGKTLWYAGLASAQAGDNATAQTRLEKLLAQELPDEIRLAVVGRLDEVRRLQGLAPAVAAATPAAAGPELVLEVQLDPALAAQVPKDAVLFVFAKAAGGPPMPLAVQRLPGARLPLTVRLDDRMGMTPAMKLSQFDRWVVTARLSATGGAQAQSGDLQGSIELGREALGRPQPLRIVEQVR